jgi:FKBP-type peptidyl-prolyl cis-trans isomerase SlyD
MQIAKDKVVMMDYTLKDGDGQVIDTSEGSDPLAYLHGAENIIPGLERELEGKSVGDNIQTVVQPADGYGERNNELQQAVARENFEEVPDLEVGMQFRVPADDEEENFVVVTVVGFDEETVTVDGNHPLAGVTLHFDVTIREIREATAEELAHGHVHGPGGHEH